MKISIVSAAFLATAVLLAAPLTATAQAQGEDPHHPQGAPGAAASPERPATGTAGAPEGMGMMDMMPPGMMMREEGAMPMAGSDMIGCPMMAHMMSHMMSMHPGMASMMERGTGGPSGQMMGRGAGAGPMMQPGGTGMASGVVTPVQHLSVDDVRHYFEHRLKRAGNDRLKLGNVAVADDEERILAEIVTVDDSLVERLEVDRHSGRVQRAQ